MLQLMIHLTVQSMGPPEGKFDAPKDNLWNLHKDAQKRALEVALELTCGCTC